MSQRVTKVRVKQANGSFGTAVPIGVESSNVTMADGTGLEDALTTIRSSITGHRILTQVEYNNLTDIEKQNGTIYFVIN